MRRWKELARQYSGWLIVLVTGLLVPIITNLTSSWLEAAVGRTPNRLLQLLAVGVAAAVALWVVGMILRERQDPLELVPRDARPERYPGLIALVGKGKAGEKPEPREQAAAKAIEYHLGDDNTLKICWLVASGGKEGSILAAQAISSEYESRCKIRICEVGSAFSVQDTYDAVQRIYSESIYDGEFREYGLAPDRVIADFTGGSAPMTAGMALACGRDRPMQYTTGRRARGEAEIASIPLLVEFKPTPRRRRGG